MPIAVTVFVIETIANSNGPPALRLTLPMITSKRASLLRSKRTFGNARLTRAWLAPMPTPRAVAPPRIAMFVTLRGDDCEKST